MTVSILVLMDLSFLQNNDCRKCKSFSSFNPCSYGSFVLTKNEKIRKIRIYAGFNPCSYGSFVLTAKQLINSTSYYKFQSLFLWIFRSYNKTINGMNGLQGKFQSLFLWIFRSYYNPNGNNGNCHRVSILVLMDLSFLQPNNIRLFQTYGRFQSLFLWIFRSYEKTMTHIISFGSCFNPCSYGSFVLTQAYVETFGVKTACFNPCSYGSFVLTKKWKIKWLTQCKVSILVLMDLSFLPCIRACSLSLYFLRFNPCSYGSFVLTER